MTVEDLLEDLRAAIRAEEMPVLIAQNARLQRELDEAWHEIRRLRATPKSERAALPLRAQSEADPSV